MKQTHKRILVAMSGGVDSSVAAYLLKKDGFEVGGATIRTWASGDCAEKNTKACCGVIGVEDARSVAWKLGIPHYVFNFESEFKTHVVDYFSSEYLKGRTPNPCIACNQHIKFSLFLKRARQLGYDAIATGHYAQVAFDESSSHHFIREGKDPTKDQSYVLFPLPEEVLENLYLPIGGYSKMEIRALARALDLRVADKPDSQEICFIPSNDYGAFLEREVGVHRDASLPEKPGLIRDRFGNVLGEHPGYYHYTIGQRKGLKIPFKHALYVVDIIPSQNTVVVGTKKEVASRLCRVERINWFASLNGTKSLRVQAKIRSRHSKAWATLERIVEGEATILFDEPQEAVTPGQGCVFYEGDRILGGGWIATNVGAPLCGRPVHVIDQG
ncbi:MAG: tRNA 2-thiouridine(34) synthase MnmA [Candidatus Omnitrophica bacterium]|nr:tRNA 2-thiouridine(34) synthase MnmA [Candidatus Omnitrophota bacterium]